MYRPPELHRSDIDYFLTRLTPIEPLKVERDEVIESISTEFYEILDQASAAEGYQLFAIAGMGYRKALEYLVKDYVTLENRNLEVDAAASESDRARARIEIMRVREEPLAASIRKIPDPLTKQVAERCAWLGNDESHYTRLWTEHDIEDLKNLLRLVSQFISAESMAKTMIAKMPKP